MSKKVVSKEDEIVSNYFREVAKKGWAKRRAKILEKAHIEKLEKIAKGIEIKS